MVYFSQATKVPSFTREESNPRCSDLITSMLWGTPQCQCHLILGKVIASWHKIEFYTQQKLHIDTLKKSHLVCKTELFFWYSTLNKPHDETLGLDFCPKHLVNTQYLPAWTHKAMQVNLTWPQTTESARAGCCLWQQGRRSGRAPAQPHWHCFPVGSAATRVCCLQPRVAVLTRQQTRPFLAAQTPHLPTHQFLWTRVNEISNFHQPEYC